MLKPSMCARAIEPTLLAATSEPPDRAPPQAERAGLRRHPLLPGRKAARPPSGEHAFQMRVAASRGVPFGQHQHVLTEGGQIATAKRAAVGGRLAVLRPAQIPPAGARTALVHSSKDACRGLLGGRRRTILCALWSIATSGSWRRPTGTGWSASF